MAVNNPIGLATLLSFIKQPQAQAGPVDFSRFMQPRPRSPEAAATRQAEGMAALSDTIYGRKQQGQDAIVSPFQLNEDEFIEGESNPFGPMLNVQQEQSPDFKAATGIYDESRPIQQRMTEMNQRMLESGNPGFAKQWSGNQAAMQGSHMSNAGAMERAKWAQQNPGMGSYGKNALDAGYIKGTRPFQDFVQMQSQKKMFEEANKKPFNTAALSKWMTPDGKSITYGTPEMAQQGKIVMRNTMAEGGAGKLGMLEDANNSIDEIMQNMYFEDGEVDPRVVQDMFLKDTASSWFGGVGGSAANYAMSPAGQLVSNSFERGIQAITRIETGAAMPDTELQNTKRRFQPQPGEGAEVIKQKFKAYQHFIKNAKKYLSPIRRDGSKASLKDIDRAIDDSFMQTSGAVPTIATGTRRGGWEYTGGEPGDKNNWRRY